MKHTLRILTFFALSISILPQPFSAWAAPAVRVGNGDDGSDLEGATPLTSGKIFDARAKAVTKLKQLYVQGVPGLGKLIPETERSTLYLSQRDSSGKLASDQGSYHADMRGLVFARTMPEPHAPTRFFPAAEKLDEDQLVALHIHEALHRSLPADVRENEAIVSELTLSIVSPEGSHDLVRETAARVIPVSDRVILTSASTTPATYEAAEVAAPAGSLAAEPSLLSYEFRSYRENSELSAQSKVSSMSVLQSFLYPFGGKASSFGFGIEASLINQPNVTLMGPLSVSARYRLWSGRGFDVGIWGTASLNTLSAEELKNSRFGRDVSTLGLSMRKDVDYFYVENFLSYSGSGEASKSIGRVSYNYQYGGVVNAQIHAGATFGFLKAGAYSEIFLADYYRVSGGAYTYDSGRYRIVSAGPEVTARFKNFLVTVYGRFLVNAPADIDFDALGNLMGPGSGQGSLGLRASLQF